MNSEIPVIIIFILYFHIVTLMFKGKYMLFMRMTEHGVRSDPSGSILCTTHEQVTSALVDPAFLFFKIQDYVRLISFTGGNRNISTNV